MPQLIVSVFIIYVGLKLIAGKKEELKSGIDNDTKKKDVYPLMIEEMETSDKMGESNE